MICKPYDNHRIWFVIKSWLHFLVASLVKTTRGDHWGWISSLWCGFLGCCWTWVLSVLHGFSTGTTCWMILGSPIGDRLGIPPVYCWMCDCTLRFWRFWGMVIGACERASQHEEALSLFASMPKTHQNSSTTTTTLTATCWWIHVPQRSPVPQLGTRYDSANGLWSCGPKRDTPVAHIFVVSNARECQYFPFKSFQSLLVIFSQF